jgi:hypothetical protein
LSTGQYVTEINVKGEKFRFQFIKQ